MILAGDVGGTKTLLGIFEQREGKLVCAREAELPSQEFARFDTLIEEFMAGGQAKIGRCVLGVAGPIVSGRSERVNLSWPVDTRRVAGALGLDAGRVRLLNDVEATAWGVPALGSRNTVNLTPGVRGRPGNAGLIAVGTGLGMALLLWDGRRHHPLASEGGHREFGPRDDDEIDLLKFLRRRHDRVSVERVLSGAGMSAIYRFVVETGRASESPAMRRRLEESDHRNLAIARAGLSGEDDAAVQALDRFVSILGATAGDLALVAGATGGIFIGGGIVPGIVPRLESEVFLRAFRGKGRLTSYMERIPARAIIEPRTAMLGAAACAATLSKPRTGSRTRKGKGES